MIVFLNPYYFTGLTHSDVFPSLFGSFYTSYPAEICRAHDFVVTSLALFPVKHGISEKTVNWHFIREDISQILWVMVLNTRANQYVGYHLNMWDEGQRIKVCGIIYSYS